jgi:PAS domain S-box-containing protein
MTIKNKILFWFLLPSILIATVTTVFCYVYTYKMTKRNIFDQLEIAADELHKEITLFLSGKKERTVDFSSDGLIRDCAEEIARKDSRREYYIKALNTHLVTNKKPLDPDILAIFVVDLDGKVIGSTDLVLLGQDISDETYFSETMKRGAFITDIHYPQESGQNIFFGEGYFSNTIRMSSYISDLLYSPEFRQNAFFDVTRLLLRKGGQNPIGIIVNRYIGDGLKKLTRSEIKGESGKVKQMLGFGETGEAYIVNRDKLMITESRFIENAMYNQVVDTKGVRVAFDNGIGVTGIYPDYRGIPVLGVYKYLEEMDWVIVASKYVSEAFAPVTFLRNFTIITGTTGIIIIVVVAVFISTGITSSIEKTAEVTRRIVKSDLAHPVTTYKSMDEFIKLGGLINSTMNKYRQASLYNVHSIGYDDMSLLQLQRSSGEWVTIFDANTDIITIHDKDTRIIRANKAFYEDFNIDKKELNKKKCFEVFHCSETTFHNCLLVKCATSLRPECEEVEDPNMGGIFLTLTYPLLDEKGVFHGAVRQIKNITEKKKVDKEIKRAKGFSENLIETAQDAIVCIDEEGIVRVWNNSAEKMFGYSRSEIIGQPITAIIPERYKNRHEEGLRRFLQTGQHKIIGKSVGLSGKTKEGLEVPIELSLSFQKIEGKRYFFTGIIRDRTFEVQAKKQLIDKSNELAHYSRTLEQKVEERTLELREANKKLQKIDKAKTEFLSIVSHELRTPLAAVLGYAKIINNRLKDVIFPNVREDSAVVMSTMKVNKGLGTIISEGERLTELINDLLDITKIEAGKVEWEMEPVSVAEIIERAITTTASSFEQYGLELISDVEDRLPDVVGDKDRLHQVMINLISNAMKFTENGSVTCRARKINNEIIISVIDTGTGISDIDKEKIFEKFTSTTIKGKPRGTGLGLPICKEIVRHHGGRLWVESELGKGSAFSFTMPCSTGG